MGEKKTVENVELLSLSFQKAAQNITLDCLLSNHICSKRALLNTYAQLKRGVHHFSY